jgi:hypothetical protein
VTARTGRRMEGPVGRPFLALLLLAASAATSGAQPQEGDCGFDRWPVKILRDRDAKRVGRDTVQTTIQQLNAIPIPDIPYPRDKRISPHELIIYRLSGYVERIRTEDDRDWHLVLSDPADSRHTMIVEIPDPACAKSTPFGPAYQSAREALRRVPKRGLVEVTGVGFFDFIHTQRGISRNGFELHPVLSLRALPGSRAAP